MACLTGGRCLALGVIHRRGLEQATDEPFPGFAIWHGHIDDLEKQKPKPQGMTEGDQRRGVYGTIDTAFGLGGIHNLGQTLMSVTHARPKQIRHIGFVPGCGK